MFSKTFINVYIFTLFVKEFAELIPINSMEEGGKSEKLSTLRHNGSHTEVKSREVALRC